MWFFDLIPESLIYLLFLAAGTGYVISLFLPLLLFQKQVKIASIIALVTSIYLLGMMQVNTYWKNKISLLQAQVVELAAKSSETNAVINTKVITRTQVIRERGADVIKYVDLEVVRYNNTCMIPVEFVTAHNLSAKQPP